MTTILKNTCFPCCWNYNVLVAGNYSPCPGKLIITYSSYTIGSEDNIAVKFNGGSLVGSLCANTDPYVTVVDNGYIQVDVVAALLNQAWSSSCEIEIYSQITVDLDQTQEVSVLVGNCDSYFKEFWQPKGGGLCAGYGLVATVTVNSNGTYSIA